MTPEQREELKQAALKATPGPWHSPGLGELHTENHDEIAQILYAHTDEGYCGTDADADYIALANPEAVLSLIAQVEALEAKFVIGERPADEQEWAKIDPAIAFHLIERHADNWNDAGDMMVAWANARQAAQVQALTVPQWISVEDRLPDEGQRVLVARYAGRVINPGHPGHPGVHWLEVTVVEKGMFLCDIISTGNATHWQALPTIPAIPGTKEAES
jgi:hypothetical protein